MSSKYFQIGYFNDAMDENLKKFTEETLPGSQGIKAAAAIKNIRNAMRNNKHHDKRDADLLAKNFVVLEHYQRIQLASTPSYLYPITYMLQGLNNMYNNIVYLTEDVKEYIERMAGELSKDNYEYKDWSEDVPTSEQIEKMRGEAKIKTKALYQHDRFTQPIEEVRTLNIQETADSNRRTQDSSPVGQTFSNADNTARAYEDAANTIKASVDFELDNDPDSGNKPTM